MVDLFLVWHENFRVIDTTSGLINMISLSERGREREEGELWLSMNTKIGNVIDMLLLLILNAMFFVLFIRIS